VQEIFKDALKKIWSQERRKFERSDAAHGYNPLKCGERDAH